MRTTERRNSHEVCQPQTVYAVALGAIRLFCASGSSVSGMAMEDTFSLISKNYLLTLDNVKVQKDMSFSYDHMKDKLFLCVVNSEKNQKMLDSVPHQKIEDLAVLHRCLIHSSNYHSGSILVNNKLLDEWEISEETLHHQALRNMDRIFTLGS